MPSACFVLSLQYDPKLVSKAWDAAIDNLRLS